jgi:UDP-glucuronate 4-epimerase
MKRDFTYIDDIVEGVFQIAEKNEEARFNILNIGNSSPVQLLDFIGCIEEELQISSIKLMQDMQPGDVINTWADTKELVEAIGYRPSTNIKDGVKKFISWYKNYYNT